MAENLCYAYPRAQFWEKLPDDKENEWLKNTVELSMEAIEKIKNTPKDITNVKRIQQDIYAMASKFVGRDDDVFYQKATEAGILDLVDWRTLSLKSDKEALKTAVTVNAVANGLRSMGGALQLQADSFLKAYRDNPAQALSQGIELGRRLREVDEMASVVMLQDLQDGRMTYVKRFRESAPVKNSKMFNDLIGPKAEQLEKLVNQISELDEANRLLRTGRKEDMAEGLRKLKDIATLTKSARDPLTATAYASNLSRLGQMIWTVAMDGMLSSPATWVVNATNLAYAYARPIFQYLPAKTIALATGNANASQAAVEAVAALTEMNVAFFDGMRIAWDTMASGMALYGGNPDLDMLATRRSGGINAQNVNEMIEQTRWLKTLGLGQYQRPLKEGSAIYNSIDVAGRAIGVPNSVVTATDDWIKHLVVRGEVARRAVRDQLKEVGDIAAISSKDEMRRVIDAENVKAFGSRKQLSSMSLGAPDFRSQWEFDRAYEHYEAIMDEAKYVTFQQDNVVSQGANAFLKKFPALRPFMPFVRTPTNIIAQGIGDTTPLGALMKGGLILTDEGFNPWRTLRRVNQEIIEAQAEDPGAFYRHIGQLSFGTTMLGMVYAGVMSRDIVGGGPHRWLTGNQDEWDAQRAWEDSLRAQGKEPYSIETPFGRMKFDRFPEPFAIMLRMVADYAEYASHMSEIEQDMVASTQVMMIASGLYNASFLTGIGQFMEAMTDDDSAGTKKVKLGQGYLETFTPYGGLLRMINAAPGMDPYRDNLRGVGSNDVYSWRVMENFWGTGLGARFAGRIPGLGNQPLMIDQVVGAPMPMYPGGGPQGLNPLYAAIPILPRGIQGDEVWDRIFKIRGKYNEASINGVRLDPYEKAQFNRLMGTTVINGRTLREAIMEFSDRADVQEYMASKTGAKIRALDNKKRTRIDTQFDMIKNQYAQVAGEEMKRLNPNVSQRYELGRMAAYASQRGDEENAKKINQTIAELERAARNSQGRPIQSELGARMPLLF